MAKTPIITLDLNFQGRKQAIASYLIPHSTGVVLIECETRLNSSRASSCPR